MWLSRSSFAVSSVVGVAGYPVEMECNVQPTKRDDQLLLVLWYKEGHNSPIYTFDARGKNSLAEAVHFSHQGSVVPSSVVV